MRQKIAPKSFWYDSCTTLVTKRFSIRKFAALGRRFLQSQSAERAVGAMYGGMFKRKESARNPWTHPDTGEQLRVQDPA